MRVVVTSMSTHHESRLSYGTMRARAYLESKKNGLIIYLLFIIFVYKKLWEIKKKEMRVMLHEHGP
jgi:hypothetical protein